jgi:hypothetical protein
VGAAEAFPARASGKVIFRKLLRFMTIYLPSPTALGNPKNDPRS